MSQEEIQIPKNWKNVLLRDITDSIGDGIHSTPKYVNTSDFYFINGNNLRNGSIVITQTTKKVDESEYKKYKLNLNKNTILLSINGTIGNLAFYKNEQVILGKSACYINCNDVLDPKFLFYLLQSNRIKKYFRNELTKTSIPNLSLKSVRITPILLPPMPTQKKIIQKLDHILEQLEEKKKQIFSLIEQNKERINFFEKNWLSYIIDNEIEKHPKRKEWEVVKLKDISELITKGSSPSWQGIHYVNHGVLFITSQNVGEGKLILRKKKYVENKFNEIQKHSILKKGDLLTNIVGAGIGRSALFDLDESANINQAIALIRLNDNIEKKFILLVLNSTQIIKFMHGNKVESARPNLSLAQVRNFPIPLPSIPIQKQIIQNIKKAEEKFKEQKIQFENIKQNYESRIKYINHLQSSILDSAFLGKLVS